MKKLFFNFFAICYLFFIWLSPSVLSQVGDEVNQNNGLIGENEDHIFFQFHDFQQTIPGSYNGVTYYDFDENGTIEKDETIYVNVSNGKAYVKGIEIELEYDLAYLTPHLDGFRFSGGAMWNKGEVEFPGTEAEPLQHTHPFRGLLKLRWDDPNPRNGRWFEASADLVDRYDAISESRLNSDVGYLANPQDPSSGLLRPYGLPGYSVFDIRGGFNLSDSLTMCLD